MLNDVACSSEKVGGADFNFSRASLFNRRIDDCQLMDLGFNGTPFTWKGKRRGGMYCSRKVGPGSKF